jgi:CheY-like chemotaxis protein
MPLTGRRILLVEDEYLIAEDLAVLLKEAGADVVGPAASLPRAMRLAADTDHFDAAVLDINLDGVAVFPLAQELRRRGVPMLFLTGYGEPAFPDDYAATPRCIKPMAGLRVVEELSALLEKHPATA